MCEQLLALVSCGRLQPAALSEEATEGDAGLRRAPGSGLMSDELALMWRVICTWLQVLTAPPTDQIMSPRPCKGMVI